MRADLPHHSVEVQRLPPFWWKLTYLKREKRTNLYKCFQVRSVKLRLWVRNSHVVKQHSMISWRLINIEGGNYTNQFVVLSVCWLRHARTIHSCEHLNDMIPWERIRRQIFIERNHSHSIAHNIRHCNWIQRKIDWFHFNCNQKR